MDFASALPRVLSKPHKAKTAIQNMTQPLRAKTQKAIFGQSGTPSLLAIKRPRVVRHAFI